MTKKTLGWTGLVSKNSGNILETMIETAKAPYKGLKSAAK